MKTVKRMKKLWIILFLLLNLVACQISSSSNEITSNDQEWPTNGWMTDSPEKHGLDTEKLTEMFEYIDEENLNLHSLLIVKDGRIVIEQYYDEYDETTPHVQYSVTKSFVSSLVGIALEEGYIESLDQTVSEFFPGVEIDDELKANITLENILTMRTGLGWVEGDTGYNGLYSAPNGVEYMLDLPMHGEPGDDFAYCSGCSFLLSAIIQETTDTNTAEFAEENLFEPLGIENYTWETISDGTPNGGWGLFLTPRQMAKFGYLYLNEGQWDGEQIIPENWVKESIEPGRWVDMYVDYGYQWWIFKDLEVYAAQGLYGQKIFVVPHQDMVIVMTADLYSDSAEFTLLYQYILPSIQE